MSCPQSQTRTNERENDIINFLPIKFDLCFIASTENFSIKLSNLLRKLVNLRAKRTRHTHLTNKNVFISKSWQMISWLFYLFYVGLFHFISKLDKSVWVSKMSALLFDTHWKSNDFSLTNFLVRFYGIKDLTQMCSFFSWVWSTLQLNHDRHIVPRLLL